MSPELFHGFRPDQIAALFGFDVDGDALQSLGFSTADFEFKNDGILQLAADHSSHSAAVSVPQTEEARPIYELGSNPVDKEGFTPEQLKNPHTNPDLQENLNKAADALAESDTSMPPEKVNEIKSAMTDPNGWEEKRAGDLKGKKVLMAHGDKHGEFGAEERILRLDSDIVVYEKTIRYTVDGVTYEEKLYMPKDCANLSIDASPDEPAPLATIVQVDTCPIDGTLLDGKADGAYQADTQQAYWDRSGRHMADVRAVIESDSLEDARKAGLADHRAHPDSFTHIYYRDADGCLHYVGCIKPGGDKIGTEILWDKDIDDTNKNGRYDKGEGRVLVSGAGHEAVESVGELEKDLRKQGITKFE